MEPIEQAYYQVKFENEFLKAKGNAFQTFFNNLMGRAYKSDYMPCRPWGNQGDRKNDGFLKSERRLFQVYAPNEMTEREAVAKIRDDFAGALAYWNQHFDKWAFVHNTYDGIPFYMHREMLDLENANSGVKLDPWGLEELRNVFRLILRVDLETWLGFAPTMESKAKLGFQEIQVILESIATRKPDPTISVRPLPFGKIEANQLSESVALLIKEGMTKTPLIHEFFGKWYDPLFGERTASAFRDKYNSLRGSITPNEIFYEIQDWVGGTLRGTAEHEMAVLAVIAYFFERCDIFEEPVN
jgi:hypothetical protein